MLRLYDFENATGPNLTQTDDSSLSDFNDRVSSIRVIGGCQWVLYEDSASDEDGNSAVIGPGPVTYLDGDFGIPDNSLSSIRRLPVSGPPAIVLFQHNKYFGDLLVLNSSCANLTMADFDNITSSFIITGGFWQFYVDFDYQGNTNALGVGLYENETFLVNIGNDDLSSVRLVGKRDVM